jgi:hypothetical protein
MLSVKEFWEKGKDIFNHNDLINLATVYTKLRKSCLLSKEITQKVKEVYSSCLNFKKIPNPGFGNSSFIFIYNDTEPETPNSDILSSKIKFHTYIGNILGFYHSGALHGELPNVKRINLRYVLYHNSKRNRCVFNQICFEDVDDSLFLKSLNYLCREISSEGNHFTVKKEICDFIFMSMSWLNQEYFNGTDQENFFKKGRKYYFEEILLKKLYDIYKSNKSLIGEITYRDLNKLNEAFPLFFEYDPENLILSRNQSLV